MPRRVSRAEAVALARSRGSDRSAFVGVDGAGGAGKSSLAEAIAAGEPRAVVISTDDLQGPAVAEWDWPRLQEQVIVPLLAGRPGCYERWNWGETTPRGWVVVPVGALVVVEGVSATRRELAVPWDLTIWVEAPEDVRRARVGERDGPATLGLWRDHWWPSEEAYMARERPQQRVDLIVDGTE